MDFASKCCIYAFEFLCINYNVPATRVKINKVLPVTLTVAGNIVTTLRYRLLLKYSGIVYLILYGGVAVAAAIACIYPCQRKGNAFAADTTPPVRLRRWGFDSWYYSRTRGEGASDSTAVEKPIRYIRGK